MQTLDQPTREKIERRARRAWRQFDRGKRVSKSRISAVTDDSLLYRLKHKPGMNLYSGKKITITRDDIGVITVPDSLPADPLLDLRSKSDVTDKLKNQCGPVRAYKLTKADGQGCYKGGITYKVGETVKEPKAVTDRSQDCAAGINLCNLEWAKKNHQIGYRIFAVEFAAPDNVAAIPSSSDGKFRVFECKVIEELDLVALGLEKPPPADGKSDGKSDDDDGKPGLLGRLLGPTS